MDPTDLAEMRMRHIELLGQYQSPIKALAAHHRASWLKVWTNDCKRTGKFVPFEEWYHSPGDDGIIPFEVGGGLIDVTNSK